MALSGHGRVSVRRQRCHEAEELERQPVGVAAAGAELGSDARDAEQAEGAGDGVADGGEGLVRGGGAVPSSPNATSRT